MIKMLKLSPYCYPERVSSSHLSSDLSTAYIKAGIMVENYVPTPTRGVSKEVRKKYKKIKYEERNDGQTVIYRFPMFAEGKNPVMRAIRYLLVNLIQLWYGSKANGIDIIYSASTPPTQGLLCGIVKRRLSKRYRQNVPYLYCLHDVFPDSLVNANMTRKGSLLWNIGRKIEDFTYKSADKIIVISNDIKKNIMKKGVPAEKIIVVPNWINTDNVKPVARTDNRLFDELNLNRGMFYVTYAGNLGKAQSIDTILQAAKLLNDQKDIEFVLFGGGAGQDDAEIKIKQLDNVKLFPLMPPERVAEVYSLGDVSIVACKKGFGTGAIPSKTFSIMATATPIMLSFDKDSELWNLINDSDSGFLCEAENALELSKAIIDAKNNPDSIKRKGKNALDLVREEYSEERGTKAYIELITQMVGNNR